MEYMKGMEDMKETSDIQVGAVIIYKRAIDGMKGLCEFMGEVSNRFMCEDEKKFINMLGITNAYIDLSYIVDRRYSECARNKRPSRSVSIVCKETRLYIAVWEDEYDRIVVMVENKGECRYIGMVMADDYDNKSDKTKVIERVETMLSSNEGSYKSISNYLIVGDIVNRELIHTGIWDDECDNECVIGGTGVKISSDMWRSFVEQTMTISVHGKTSYIKSLLNGKVYKFVDVSSCKSRLESISGDSIFTTRQYTKEQRAYGLFDGVLTEEMAKKKMVDILYGYKVN